MIGRCIIIVAVAWACDGQLADYFFPEVTKASRDVVIRFTRTPLVSFASKTSGDLIAAAVQTFSWAPTLLARTIGVGDNWPVLVNNNNIFGSVDKFIADYNFGLGNEDASLPINSIVPKYGYFLEEHGVVTEDGFELTMFRIPGNGSAVFLMHGLLGSADDYIVAGPDHGLAYLLAREGYDVWLGNARGNKHSRKHFKLRPSDADFWDFSWHEIGIYDLPAMIDYILEETNQTAVKYIGHSQGTTSFFVMASELPEYNKKISLMIALSPVAFMSNVKSPLVRLLSPGTALIHAFAKSVGIYEFLPDYGLMKTMKLLMCGTGSLAEVMCGNIMFMVCGFGFEQFNFTNLPVLLGHVPSGAATKQFTHYGQGVISGKFRRFDYGADANLVKYGSENPPDYALENIQVPISLFYSDADWLAQPRDVDLLYNKLGSAIDIHKVPSTQFNHLDFLWANDFKNLIFKRVRKLLKYF